MKKIVVVDYDPKWPQQFRTLRCELSMIVGDIVVAIEHVGSTSVSGLAAKPVIDVDVVVAPDNVDLAIERLTVSGYRHRGNLGVEGREAFYHPPHSIRHHLYLCPQASVGLRNHLAVRDFLRAKPQAVASYGELKKRLATDFAADIDAYIDGKTEFIMRILRQCGQLSDDELHTIELANRN